MKKTLAAAAVVFACLSTPAMAQLKLPSLPGKSKPAAGSTTPPSGDALVTSFLESQGQVLVAQATLAEALGLKDRLALLQAEHKALSSGTLDREAVKKVRELSESTGKQLATLLEAQPELGADARKKFAEGLVEYVKAAAGARNLLLQAQQFTASAGANPMSLMGKAATALYVGKETPGYVKNLAGTTRSLFDFAKRNNIKTPANATAALDGL